MNIVPVDPKLSRPGTTNLPAPSEINRRRFIQQSSVLAGGLALYGAVRTGTQAAEPPSERIRYALIGCGGQGMGHLDSVLRLKKAGYPVEIVAVCDVYSRRRKAAARKTGATPYTDYRLILDLKAVDAVGIATPDHWHCKMVLEAAAAGKDVYCEKPLTHWRDLTEPRRIVEAIANSVNLPQVIRGHQATVYPNKNPGAVIQFEEATKPNTDEIRIERTRTGTVEEHYRNFLDCVKSRNKPRSNELLALRVMTALNMGIHSYRTGRTWEYDSKGGKSRAV